MKLPDPLIVRYFRAEELDHITLVTEEQRGEQRNFAVTLVLPNGRERCDRFTHLIDVGWVPA